MADKTGKSESRELLNGEIVHLVKDPGSKWRIRFYECRHNVHLAGLVGGPVFKYLEGLPQHWSSQEFESVDDAMAFAQEEISQGRVPRNS